MAVVVLIKILVVFGIIRLFGYSNRIAVLSGAGLFQIGEFGFIIAQGGLVAGIITQQFYSLILSTAILTMLLTLLSLSLVTRFYPHIVPARVMKGLGTKEVSAQLVSESSPSTERVIIAGYGRIGQNVAQGLQDVGVPFMVIEIDSERIAELRQSGKPRIYGDASNAHVLSQAGLNRAKTLVVTFPDPLAMVNTVRVALEINPDLNIVARVHRTREVELLKSMGVTELISPEYEASLEFLKRTLAVSGWGKADVRRILPIVQEDQEIVEFSSDKEE